MKKLTENGNNINQFNNIRNNTKEYIIKCFGVMNFQEVIDICINKINTYEKWFGKKCIIDICQIDHVKPKSKFNLRDVDEFYKCCHHSNLQIIDKHSNLSKNNKWSEKDEIFWNEHILFQRYDKIY